METTKTTNQGIQPKKGDQWGLVDLIFALIERFVPMTAEQWAELRQEAKSWEKVQTTTSDDKLGRLYATYCRHWVFRVGTAVAFPILVKVINNWMTEVPPVNETEE